MSVRSVVSLSVAFTMVALVRPVFAQRHRTAVIGAGVAAPTQEFASDVSGGWQISGGLDFPLGPEVTSFRIELAYVHFGSSTLAQNPRMVPLLLSFVAIFPTGRVQPFLIGGTGLYYLRTSNPEFTDNKFGLNLGVGLTWTRLSMEGRYHSVFDRGDTYWSLTMGLRL